MLHVHGCRPMFYSKVMEGWLDRLNVWSRETFKEECSKKGKLLLPHSIWQNLWLHFKFLLPKSVILITKHFLPTFSMKTEQQQLQYNGQSSSFYCTFLLQKLSWISSLFILNWTIGEVLDCSNRFLATIRLLTRYFSQLHLKSMDSFSVSFDCCGYQRRVLMLNVMYPYRMISSASLWLCAFLLSLHLFHFHGSFFLYLLLWTSAFT